MKVASLSLAMVVMTATNTYGFQVGVTPFRSTSALQMGSYEEQLAALGGNSQTLDYTPNGSVPVEQKVAVMPPPVPVPVPVVAPMPAPVPVVAPMPAPVPVAPMPAPVPVAPLPQPSFVLPPTTAPYQPPPVPAPVPMPQPVLPPPPAPVAITRTPSPPPAEIQVSEDKPALPAAAVAFLGLPLWLLVGSQFVGTPAPAPVMPSAPITATTSANTIALPEGLTSIPSAANTAGVVVLSQPITKAEVRGLFDLWNDALKTGDPATVAQRYSREGVLLPTLSDVPRNDFEAIKDYFVGFLSKKPTGKILEGEIFVGNNWAQDAGIYEFTFEDGSKVKARYSFVYVYEDGKWMISHHHSSLMPQETVRPVKVTEEQVRGFFGLWNDALKTGDPKTVAARYSKDAVLLPTLSDRARYTNDAIADYFVGFLSKKPTGEILEGNIKIGPNWAQDAGIYEFTFEDGSKTRGRYSYVYTYEKGQWLISNHHSSIMPEPAVAAFKKVNQLEAQLAATESPAIEKMSEMEKRFAEMEKRFYGPPASAPAPAAVEEAPAVVAPAPAPVVVETAPAVLPVASEVVQMQTSWEN